MFIAMQQKTNSGPWSRRDRMFIAMQQKTNSAPEEPNVGIADRHSAPLERESNLRWVL